MIKEIRKWFTIDRYFLGYILTYGLLIVIGVAIVLIFKK
jgi:hypothetical protein